MVRETKNAAQRFRLPLAGRSPAQFRSARGGGGERDLFPYSARGFAPQRRLHDDGGIRPGQNDHLAAGAAESLLRFVARSGVRQKMAEVESTAARLVEGRA